MAEDDKGAQETNEVGTEVETKESAVKETTEAATKEADVPNIYTEKQEKEATETEAKQKAKQPEVELKDFQLPEGFKANEKQMEQFKAIAKELKLDQDGAQKLVNLRAEFFQQDIAAQEAALKEQQKQWLSEIQADTEYGGTKLEHTRELTKRAIRELAGDNFAKLLSDVGITDHPEVIKYLAKVGKSLSEDRFVDGKAPAPEDTRTPYDKMYTKMD